MLTCPFHSEPIGRGDRGPSPGPAPAAHALVKICSVSRSSWRTCPKVNARRKVPRVEGAMTRWPCTWLVAPQRSRSASSMQSPPASMVWTRVSSLRPGRAGLLAQVDQRIGGLLDAQPLGQRGRQQQARIGHRMDVVKQLSSWSRLWQDRIEKAPC